MRTALQVVTGTAFLAATILNVRTYGFNPATTCSLISGMGFFLGVILELKWKH